MDPLAEKRIDVLLEEWKTLSGFIESAFRILEKQSIYVVVILGAAVGIGVENPLNIPKEIWIFAPFAIMVLMFRLSSQVTFSLFQAVRILEIEKQANKLLGSKEDGAELQGDQEILWYGHVVQYRARELLAYGAYPFLPWLWLQELLALFVVGFCAVKATWGSCPPISEMTWKVGFWILVLVCAFFWIYQLIVLTIAYVKWLPVIKSKP